MEKKKNKETKKPSKNRGWKYSDEKSDMCSYMKNGQLWEYPRSLEGDVCWLLLPRYLPDQAVSVKQNGRIPTLSQALIPKENKEGPSFAWATEPEGRLASGF